MLNKVVNVFLLSMVCIIVFIFFSGVLFDNGTVNDNYEDVSNLLNKETKEYQEDSFNIIKYKSNKSDNFRLSTDFDMSDSENLYVYSEGDMTVGEVERLLDGITLREDVSEVLGVSPVSLIEGIREEVYLIGYAETYEAISKTINDYKEDIENNILNILVVIKYNEERVIEDVNIYSKG